jgi:predicted nucleic acid-binding protein
MPFVLDASIAACWCFHDENDPRADAAIGRLINDSAVVPLLWWFEVRNAVLLAERRRRVTEQWAAAFFDQLHKLRIDFAELQDQDSVLVLARRHRLTFYDAAYLELAQRQGLALATLDDDLAEAARAEGVALIAAS